MDEESQAIIRVLSAFHNYQDLTLRHLITPKRVKHSTLTNEEQKLLSWFPSYLDELHSAVSTNQRFLDDMIQQVAKDWGMDLTQVEFVETSIHDYEKVKKALKQVYREWSSECQQERNVSFKKIIGHLTRKYPVKEQRSEVKVLIPGCGLGRLNFELIKEGFSVQGNEYDYFIIILSSFLINHGISRESYQIHPFIHDQSNQRSRESHLRAISIPDIDQFSALRQLQTELPSVDVMELMSITTGSFVDLYGPNDQTIQSSSNYTKQGVQFRAENTGKFDYIITHFFIDTVSNLIEYLKSLSHSLKAQTGEWINFGPLQWHFENSSESIELRDPFGIVNEAPLGGLELARDDVLQLLGLLFDITEKEENVETGYALDKEARAQYLYFCDYWVAKPKV